MKQTNTFNLSLLCFAIFLWSCESDAQRKLRLMKEEQQRIELENEQKAKEAERAYQAEQERIEREARLEEERKEREIYEKYINNSLYTGATPYSRYYGGNAECDNYGCSQIKIRTSNSDVIVLIKKNNRVVRHAYISKGSGYTFSFPDGTYQTFFYYGKGWNPEKIMKGGKLKGGFIRNESFGKDEPQYLSNNVLQYELILQRNGNFHTRQSNADEAL